MKKEDLIREREFLRDELAKLSAKIREVTAVEDRKKRNEYMREYMEVRRGMGKVVGQTYRFKPE